ncbi:hypothetical protein CEXT_133531 [Caerostris extrusa]|uniref:Uncharacterized protein n=1 Tax=Caerostris extrusa TaxID=172846 RepID=A0AAV4N153_CAEEX|nr:hypothetical protein CEXT_133531 [Caerostris extrusa]
MRKQHFHFMELKKNSASYLIKWLPWNHKSRSLTRSFRKRKRLVRSICSGIYTSRTELSDYGINEMLQNGQLVLSGLMRLGGFRRFNHGRYVLGVSAVGVRKVQPVK